MGCREPFRHPGRTPNDADIRSSEAQERFDQVTDLRREKGAHIVC